MNKKKKTIIYDLTKLFFKTAKYYSFLLMWCAAILFFYSNSETISSARGLFISGLIVFIGIFVKPLVSQWYYRSEKKGD